MRHHLPSQLLLIALFCLGLPVQAQSSYSCRMPDGRYAVSSYPCPTGTTPGLSYHAPVAPPTPTPSYRPQITTAPPPDFLPYLSPRCSGMNDAVRTSAARGLGHQAAQELRRNYQYECGAEEKFARQQMAGGQASQRRADYEQRKAQVSSEMQSQAATDQCRESMRIIKTKRNRPNLTEGEKADLQRFEDNIRARCT